jgi:hypothetical protein
MVNRFIDKKITGLLVKSQILLLKISGTERVKGLRQ